MPATKDYWCQILSSLKTSVSSSNYQSWLSGIQFRALENNGEELILEVPSKFNQNYIESKFLNIILETAGKYYTKVKHISFIVKNSEKIKKIKPETDGYENIGFFDNSNQQPDIKNINQENEILKINQVLPTRNLHGLNNKYTFENYVVTPHNELATSVAQRVAMEPGQKYNPLFIYSEVGLGKTHLLQAIGHKALEIHPSLKIKYITSETFVNEYIQSIQKKTSKEFSDYYRSIDLLLVDDIQFIAGKEATQEGFFHTFNELHQNNKQIVLTSDKNPKSLGGIEARLVSRFEWGIVIDISKPELEAREAIIREKANKMDLNLPVDQIRQIATKVNTNFRDMEGVLNRIQARIQLLPNRIFTDNELNSILSGFELSSTISIHINQNYQTNSSSSFNTYLKTPEKVIELVCKVFEISKETLLSKSREKNIALARQVAMFVCKRDLKMSLPAIGRVFERDHSTVSHGLNLIEKMLQNGDLLLSNKIAVSYTHLTLPTKA
jgi:chromosomal replication initiator protein